MDGFPHRVLIRPAGIHSAFGGFKPATHHGVLVPGDWDRNTYPVEANRLVQICTAHWRDGLSWEEAGMVDFQLERIRTMTHHQADGLKTRDHVLARYERLDALFEATRRWGRLPAKANREDGVYIHLTRHGHPLFGARGVHRFVIARLLDIPVVVGQLGVIHPDAPQVKAFQESPERVVRAEGGGAPAPPSARWQYFLRRFRVASAA